MDWKEEILTSTLRVSRIMSNLTRFELQPSNFFHRVNRAVDKGWPDEENADNAARAELNAQRRHKHINMPSED